MGGTYIWNFICNFISHRKKEEKMKLKKKCVYRYHLIPNCIVHYDASTCIDDLNGTPDRTGNHALRNLFMELIGLIMAITGVFAKGDTRQLFGNYSEVCYFGQDGLNSFMCITHIGSEYSHS